MRNEILLPEKLEQYITEKQKAWLIKITEKYQERITSFGDSYLKVYYQGGIRWFPLKRRFTPEYGSNLYSYLKPIQGLTIQQFWTFTFVADRRLRFESMHKKILNGWSNLRSLWAKCVNKDGTTYTHKRPPLQYKYNDFPYFSKGIRISSPGGERYQCTQFKKCRSFERGHKNVDYFRVLEFTKKLTLHIHLAVFTHFSRPRIIQISNYWTKNFAFIKLFTFSDHQIETKVSEVSIILHKFLGSDDLPTAKTYAQVSESWVKDGKLRFNPPEHQEVGGRVMRYVHKYMTKNPPLHHQAIFTKFRIRTFACSRKVSTILTSVRKAWVDSKPKEDLGQVMGTEIDFIPNEKSNKRFKEIFDRIAKRNKPMKKPKYIIDFQAGIDDFNKNDIIIPISFDDDGFDHISTDFNSTFGSD